MSNRTKEVYTFIFGLVAVGFGIYLMLDSSAEDVEVQKPAFFDYGGGGVPEVGIDEIDLLDANDVLALMFLDPVSFEKEGKIKFCLCRKGFCDLNTSIYKDAIENFAEDGDLLKSMVLEFQGSERGETECDSGIEVLFVVSYSGRWKSCRLRIDIGNKTIYGKGFVSKALYEDFDKAIVVDCGMNYLDFCKERL